jgi:hypothetical protein
MGATLQLCTDEVETLSPEKVQFTFVVSDAANNGGRIQAAEPPASLLLSVSNSAGVPVFTLKEIKLLRVGDSFMTEPLELKQGYYKITDFLLLGESEDVLYATPKVGSPLAKAVVRPLPFGFNVMKNVVANVAMEVIDVTLRLPEEFGYASFAINAVNPLRLSVFTTVGTTTNLTSARAYILKGNDTINSYAMGATINLIAFQGDAQAMHRLVVSKPGYNPYIKDFVYSDLVTTLGNLPLKIYLVPAGFTMLAFVDDYGIPNSFEFRLNAVSGSYVVEWGDGTSSVNETSHVYATAGNYLITVSGDLDKITSFYCFYGYGRMDAINVQGLTELQNFRFGLTPRGPKEIDLSKSTKLKELFIPNIAQLEHVIFPVDAPVSTVDISGPNQLSPAMVDEIINGVYQSAVLNSETSGIFVLFDTWTRDRYDMVGPPSAASLTKLRDLRDNYGWTIAPDPF